MGHSEPMDRVRVFGRALAATAALLVVVLPAVEAWANHTVDPVSCAPPSPAPTPAPTPTPTPTPGCTPATGDVITGTRTVRFQVATTDAVYKIREAKASIVSDEGIADPLAVGLSCPVPDEDAAKDGCQSQTNPPASPASYSFTWDSRTLTPRNGLYTLHAEARAATDVSPSGGHWKKVDLATGLKVDNAPITPAAPRIVVATEVSVTVEWDAAPEADVTGYTLYRAVTAGASTKPADSAFKVLATTTATSYRDEVTAPAAYWYKVRVTRRSVVTPDTGINSNLSASSPAGVVQAPKKTPAPTARPVKATSKKKKAKETPVPRAKAMAKPLAEAAVIPQVAGRAPAVPDAPFSVVLPYDTNRRPDAVAAGAPEPLQTEGEPDPRGTVLPIAVGAFLVSSALAFGRMPY